MPRAIKTSIPQHSLIVHALSRIDYGDAYRISLPPQVPDEIDGLVLALFREPKGVIEPGRPFGPFTVFERSKNEVVLGQDHHHQRHFRASILEQTEGSTRWLILSTVVQFQSWRGRLYFAPLRLVHRVIVPMVMAWAVRAMSNPQPALPGARATAIPQNTLITQALPRIDYADAYRIDLPQQAPHELDPLVFAIFSNPPGWARLLMGLRDRIVHLFGLKTAPAGGPDWTATALQPGTKFGVFRIFQRTGHEVVFGEDDRHLNFRVAVLDQTDGAQRWLTVTTIVQFHNRWGRAYFMPVRPVHRLLVPALMARAVRGM